MCSGSGCWPRRLQRAPAPRGTPAATLSLQTCEQWHTSCFMSASTLSRHKSKCPANGWQQVQLHLDIAQAFRFAILGPFRMECSRFREAVDGERAVEHVRQRAEADVLCGRIHDVLVDLVRQHQQTRVVAHHLCNRLQCLPVRKNLSFWKVNGRLWISSDITSSHG